ncbi:MAG: mannose-1-phosphate guanylyltransferase [Thermoanaerobaculia bacterium]
MTRSGTTVLILAGGAGTRLWPLSTDERPKQFLRIFAGRSLLELTWSRLAPLAASPSHLFVATNERYRPLVREQIPELPEENILVEPARRNTAPAIAACCRVIARRHPDAVVAIFPSDHAIEDRDADDGSFAAVASTAIDFAASHDALVTIGIRPTEPNTGFGYLELGEELATGVVGVRRFVEKPDLVTAQQYVDSQRFLWNGGMFVWRLSSFFEILEKVAPEIARGSLRFVEADDEQRRSLYEAMPSISIDYAVMEKAAGVATVSARFEWSDVGSWKAVARFAGASIPDNVFVEDSSRLFVRSDRTRPVGVVGLDNVAVIETEEGLLVLNLEKSELLSALVKRMGGI